MATSSKKFYATPCVCGCGGLIEIKRHHKFKSHSVPKYIHGYNTSERDKGEKRSEAHKKRLSEAKKKNPIRYWLGKKRPDMQGSNNHNWKGGITPEHKLVRLSREYKDWRESVFKRDGWVCVRCLTKGGYLHPHHIENFSSNPDKRFDINNGITLCKSCHHEFHSSFGVKNNNPLQLATFLGRQGCQHTEQT